MKPPYHTNPANHCRCEECFASQHPFLLPAAHFSVPVPPLSSAKAGSFPPPTPPTPVFIALSGRGASMSWGLLNPLVMACTQELSLAVFAFRRHDALFDTPLMFPFLSPVFVICFGLWTASLCHASLEFFQNWPESVVSCACLIASCVFGGGVEWNFKVSLNWEDHLLQADDLMCN